MKRGRKVCFHGAFGTKAAARRKESRTAKSFIRKIHVRGNVRYAVISRKG